MIVIKDIKYLVVDQDVCEIHPTPEQFLEVMNECGEKAFEEVEILTELIRGRRFKRPSDGMDAGLQDILGLQYEAWENLENNNSELRRLEAGLIDKLRGIESAGFWKRLRWVFGGVRVYY